VKWAMGNAGSVSEELHFGALILQHPLTRFQHLDLNLHKAAQSSGIAVASFQKNLF